MSQLTRRSTPLSTRHTTVWGREGDVDIFVCADTPQQCSDYARQIWNALAVDGEHWKLERARGVLNMAFFPSRWLGAGPSLVVQVVLRQYASPTEVRVLRRRLLLRRPLLVKTSGAPPVRRPVQWNVVNAIHAWPRSPAYEMRLTKYACRGFAVLCPGLDPATATTDHARVRGEQFDALGRRAALAHRQFDRAPQNQALSTRRLRRSSASGSVWR